MPSNNRRHWYATFAVGAAVGVAYCWWRRQRHRKKNEVRISAMYVYPIKSCRGVSLKKVELTSEGLLHDRRYIVIKAGQREKVVLTGREVPQLQLIQPGFPDDLGMVVQKEGMAQLTVPTSGTGVVHSVDMVLTDDVKAEDMGDEAAEWFARALGMKDVRLCRIVGQRAADADFGVGFFTGSDGFSVLVTSEASIATLADKSGLACIAQRMRPNLVVDGCNSHAEDLWSSLHWTQKDASAELVLPKPCARCTMPSIDPARGTFGQDPLNSLKAYRSGKILMEADVRHKDHYRKNKGDIFFGQNAHSVVVGRPTLSVGGTLRVQ